MDTMSAGDLKWCVYKEKDYEDFKNYYKNNKREEFPIFKDLIDGLESDYILILIKDKNDYGIKGFYITRLKENDELEFIGSNGIPKCFRLFTLDEKDKIYKNDIYEDKDLCLVCRINTC